MKHGMACRGPACALPTARLLCVQVGNRMMAIDATNLLMAELDEPFSISTYRVRLWLPVTCSQALRAPLRPLDALDA